MRPGQNEIGGTNRILRSTRTLIGRFASCERGATSIEYGLICALIFLAIVAGVQNVASKTVTMHTNIQNKL